MTEPDEQDLWPASPQDVEPALRSGHPGRVGRALLSLALNGDPRAEAAALEHAGHPDVQVRRNAATSLGHVARIAGALDLDRAVPALLRLLADPDTFGEADDALNDVEHFLGVNRGAWLGDPDVRAIAYDGFGVLEVALADGRIYRHTGVDAAAYRDLWTAPSQPGLLAALAPYARRATRAPRLLRRPSATLETTD